MFYITDESGERYYAGKCCSDNKTLVWKNHHSRATAFYTDKEAVDFGISERLSPFGVEFIVEGD
jgi:hypothetical protein